MLAKCFDDLTLGSFGLLHIGFPTVKTLHCQMKWGAAGSIANCNPGIYDEQKLHGRHTMISHSAVQGRSSILILGINHRSSLKQQPHCRDLPLCVPIWITDAGVCSIMQRSALQMIPGSVYISTGVEQHFDNLHPMPCGGNVQRGVASIDPMRDAFFVMALGHQTDRQRFVILEQTPRTNNVIVHDGGEE